MARMGPVVGMQCLLWSRVQAEGSRVQSTSLWGGSALSWKFYRGRALQDVRMSRYSHKGFRVVLLICFQMYHLNSCWCLGRVGPMVWVRPLLLMWKEDKRKSLFRSDQCCLQWRPNWDGSMLSRVHQSSRLSQCNQSRWVDKNRCLLQLLKVWDPCEKFYLTPIRFFNQN